MVETIWNPYIQGLCPECNDIEGYEESKSAKSGEDRTDDGEMDVLRWMCKVLLKDRKHNVDLYSLLDVLSVADVVRRGRLRWFGHLEYRSVDDWVSTCRKVELAGARCKGRNRKTWKVMSGG